MLPLNTANRIANENTLSLDDFTILQRLRIKNIEKRIDKEILKTSNEGKFTTDIYFHFTVCQKIIIYICKLYSSSGYNIYEKERYTDEGNTIRISWTNKDKEIFDKKFAIMMETGNGVPAWVTATLMNE